jgi:hypothetical protein
MEFALIQLGKMGDEGRRHHALPSRHVVHAPKELGV